MTTCYNCKQEITKIDFKRLNTEKDENGFRVHKRCPGTNDQKTLGDFVPKGRTKKWNCGTQ